MSSGAPDITEASFVSLSPDKQILANTKKSVVAAARRAGIKDGDVENVAGRIVEASGVLVRELCRPTFVLNPIETALGTKLAILETTNPDKESADWLAMSREEIAARARLIGGTSSDHLTVIRNAAKAVAAGPLNRVNNPGYSETNQIGVMQDWLFRNNDARKIHVNLTEKVKLVYNKARSD